MSMIYFEWIYMCNVRYRIKFIFPYIFRYNLLKRQFLSLNFFGNFFKNLLTIYTWGLLLEFILFHWPVSKSTGCQSDGLTCQVSALLQGSPPQWRVSTSFQLHQPVKDITSHLPRIHLHSDWLPLKPFSP